MDQEATPESSRLARATETWDMPVIVTTAVQFLNLSSPAVPPSAGNSIISPKASLYFDEAQMLPLPYLRPCVWSITQLVKHYRVSAVLCTATQPALTPSSRNLLRSSQSRNSARRSNSCGMYSGA